MVKARFAFILALAMVLTTGGCPGLFGPAITGSGGTSGGSGTSGSGGSSGGGTSGGGTTGGSTTTTDAGRILQLVNTERANAGLAALTRNALLDAAALAHATDMRNNNFFDHAGSNGSSVGDRATAAGYVWTAIAENIGQGDTTPDDMMNLWMNSTGHAANILGSAYTEIGIAIDDNGTALWVQVFGRP
jgi:uncharacterized protein YkwD